MVSYELAMVNYNSYASSNMDGLSPLECVSGHKANICPSIEVIHKVMVTDNYKTYQLRLKMQLAYLIQYLQTFKNDRVIFPLSGGRKIEARIC